MGIGRSAETRTDETHRGRPVELRTWLISGRRIVFRLCLMAVVTFVGLLVSALSASAAEEGSARAASPVENPGAHQPSHPQLAGVAQGRPSASGGDDHKESIPSRPSRPDGVSEGGGASSSPRPHITVPAASGAVDAEPVDVPSESSQLPLIDAAEQPSEPQQTNGSSPQEEATPAPAETGGELASHGVSMAVQTQTDQANAPERPAQRLEPVVSTAQNRLDELTQQSDATRSLVEGILRIAGEEAETTAHQVFQLLDFRSTSSERLDPRSPSTGSKAQAVLTAAGTTRHLMAPRRQLLGVTVRHLAGAEGGWMASPSSARWVTFEPAAPGTAPSPVRLGDTSAPAIPIRACLHPSGSAALAITWSLPATRTSFFCMDMPPQTPMRTYLGALTRLGAAPDSTPD